MVETVSASHFRVHFKEIANSVARGGQQYRVARHGFEMVALVSLEDLEFLQKHKYGKEARAEPEKQREQIELTRPEWMPLETLLEAYEATETAPPDDYEIVSWRYKAFYSILERTGKQPKHWHKSSG